MDNIDYNKLASKIEQTSDVKELLALREQLIKYKEAQQGIEKQGQSYSPEELSHAADSTEKVSELRHLKEYALKQRNNDNGNQSESSGQDDGESRSLRRERSVFDDPDERVKVKTRGMSR